jgi:2-polyprenyl-3-methyl-5-hydroxy-6-metoxy-1,4-benzoquinol methylase
MASILRWKIAQSAERKWWKNYLKSKDVAQYLNWKKNYWTDFLIQCGNDFLLPSNATILDAGCGPAGIFMVFPHQQVTACDPLIDHYQADLAHFSKDNYSNVHFVNSSIENFTSDQLFDTIFCLNAINHVQDINKGYDVLCQLLKPNGTIVVSIDAHNFPILKKIFKALPGDVLHPHQYDLQEYESFLTNRGLTITMSKRIKKEFIFDHYIIVAHK